MRIGILTHYNVNNQGAQLQMLFMKKFLEQFGNQVFILSYKKDFSFDKNEEKKNSASILQLPYYIKEYLFKKGFGLTFFNAIKSKKLKKFIQNYTFLPYDTDKLDCIIIGSDEVYSIDVGCNKMMYGVGLKVPAIAYAPSFGRSTIELLKEFDVYNLIKNGLSKMYQLSARDLKTKEMIGELTGKNVPIVCDPVILYDGLTINKKIVKLKKPYMLIYSYDRNMTDKQEIAEIKAYAKKHKLLTVSCGTYHKWCDKNIVCNAEEWYSYFNSASVVLTDTFHGCVVAMKHHKNLAVFIRPSINKSKLLSLLSETGLEDRQLDSITNENMEKIFSTKIDYNLVDDKISIMVKNSKKYLISALNGIGK